MQDTLRIISFGAGVQTTALAILNARGEVENPARDLVFADTGAEHPETYSYLEDHFRPWAETHGLTLHIVQSKDGTLEGYALKRRMVPSIHNRWCTDQFKVRPINRWLRGQGVDRRAPADVQIGISADESHRAVVGYRSERYVRKRWPLCDLMLTRRDCLSIIVSEGLPAPPKSGCWFCPYQGQRGWKRLVAEHPDLSDRAVALEDSAVSRNPRDVLMGHGVSLRAFLAGGVQLPMALDAALENDQGCTSGACFV